MSKLALVAVVLVAIVAALFAWFARASVDVAQLDALSLVVPTPRSVEVPVFDCTYGLSTGRPSVAPALSTTPRVEAESVPAADANACCTLDVFFVDFDDDPFVVDAMEVEARTYLRASPDGSVLARERIETRAVERSDRVTFETIPPGNWNLRCRLEGHEVFVPQLGSLVPGQRAEARVRIERSREITVRVVDPFGKPVALDDPLDGPPLGEPFTVRITRAPCVVGGTPAPEPRPLRQTCTPAAGARPTSFVVRATDAPSSWIVLLHGERALAVVPAPSGDGEVTLQVASSELEHGFGSLALCVVDAATDAPIPGTSVSWKSPGLKSRVFALDVRSCGSLERVPMVPATLEIIADGYLGANPSVQLMKAEARDLGVVRLVAAGSIVGNVARPHSGELEITAWRLVDGKPTFEANASARSDSSFAFDRLLPGKYFVRTRTDKTPSLKDVQDGTRWDFATVVVTAGAAATVTLRP